MGVKGGILARGTSQRNGPSRTPQPPQGVLTCSPKARTAVPTELSVAEEQMMIGALRAMIKGLIADYNRAAGAAVLYFCEYVSVWALFALRGKNKCDTCVATGCSTVGDLAALVDKLQNEEVLV